ncbi:MAG: phage terminase large subunit [Cyanobacteria bacterium P01_H01_bin.74]
MTSIGITGQMTGKRADLIIGDDIETPNNSETKMMREKISVKTEEFASLLTPNEESEVVYLGTPQVKQSLYNKLPDRGYAVRIWPGRYPSSKLAAYFGEMLAPTIQLDLEKHPELAGQPAEPVRFSESVLFEKEAEMGRSTFQLQMMLNTAMSDAEKYPLKLSDLIFMSLNPEIAPQKVVWASSPDLIINDLPNVGMNGDKMYRPMHIQSSDWLNYTGSIMAIDPSGRGKDETGYAIIKALNGYLYLLDVGGFSYCYSNETLEGLVQVAKQYKVNKIIYEANYGDGMFGSLLKPILNQQYPCTMEEIHSKGQKEKRIIDTLEPIMNQHRLVVDLTLIEKDFKSVDKLASHLSNTIKPQYRFFYQLTRITRDKAALKHDDRLEAVSMAVSYWTDALALDADRQIENTKQKLLEDELNHFKANVFGLQTQLPKTWVDY